MIVGVAYLIAVFVAGLVGSFSGVLLVTWWSMRQVRAQMARFASPPRGLDAETAAILRSGPLKSGAATECVRCGKSFTNPCERDVQPICPKCVMDELP